MNKVLSHQKEDQRLGVRQRLSASPRKPMQVQPLPSAVSLPGSPGRNGDLPAAHKANQTQPSNGQPVSAALVKLAGSESLLAPLTSQQLTERRECEAVIQRGFQTFFEVGKAFARIRDGRLYRDEYATFEAYCREKWHYGREYADRLIAAAEIVAHLLTIVSKPPERESQVRPLIGLTKEQAVQAWKEAIEAANARPVTARLVRTAAAKYRTADPPSAKAASKKSIKSSKRNSGFDRVIDLVQQVENAVRTERNPQTILTLLARIRGDILKLK